MAASRTSKNNRQNRVTWIVAAFNMLIEEGIEQVRVERLAKKLGVTKGSFYWHFKDRTELHDGVLKYWADEMTQTVLDQAEKFHGDPVQRIYNTLEDIIGNEKAAFDPQIRAWASIDPRAKKAVDKIDRIRFSFLHGLFVDAGFNDEEAELRARLMYYYIIGEHFVTNREPMNVRLKKLKLKLDIVLQPASSRASRKDTRIRTAQV